MVPAGTLKWELNVLRGLFYTKCEESKCGDFVNRKVREGCTWQRNLISIYILGSYLIFGAPSTARHSIRVIVFMYLNTVFTEYYTELLIARETLIM